MPATISYHPEFGLWWPDYDAGPQKCFAYVKRHLPDCDVGISHCSRKRIAVQAGGHVGLWPLRIARSFGEVHTFEAEEALYKALVSNTEYWPSIYHYHAALSDSDSDVNPRISVKQIATCLSSGAGIFPVSEYSSASLATRGER